MLPRYRMGKRIRLKVIKSIIQSRPLIAYDYRGLLTPKGLKSLVGARWYWRTSKKQKPQVYQGIGYFSGTRRRKSKRPKPVRSFSRSPRHPLVRLAARWDDRETFRPPTPDEWHAARSRRRQLTVFLEVLKHPPSMPSQAYPEFSTESPASFRLRRAGNICNPFLPSPQKPVGSGHSQREAA
jgi:hypothetical protein